jgi:hypothetical protein
MVAGTALTRMDDARVVSKDADCLLAFQLAQAAAPRVRLVGAFPPGRDKVAPAGGEPTEPLLAAEPSPAEGAPTNPRLC